MAFVNIKVLWDATIIKPTFIVLQKKFIINLKRANLALD